MFTKIACPFCRKTFRIRSSRAGSNGPCKQCGATITFGAESEDDGFDYMTLFNAVRTALQDRLGPADEEVFFSPVPLYLNFEMGAAESLRFREYVPGYTYCTCPVSQFANQEPSSIGNYELMMCSREENDAIPSLLGQLAKYTFEAVLQPRETMGPGDLFPGSNIRGLLFEKPDIPEPTFTALGKKSSILLLIGITEAEMNHCIENGCREVLRRLKGRNEFPYTTLNRESVI